MRILYDARYLLLDDRFDGVSRYSLGLARALAERDDTDMIWLVYDERQAAKLPEGEVVYANDPRNVIREVFSLPRAINQVDKDVLYSPFFMTGFLGIKRPLVLTIHDLIYFHHHTPPYNLPWWLRLGWRLYHFSYLPTRIILNRASAVATVSATAKQELLSAHATDRPIDIVLNAVDQSETVTLTPHATSSHIVYMGAFMPYKNPECLIDALAHLPDVTLDMMSRISPERRHELENRAKHAGVSERVIFHDGVSDVEYQQALKNARCLVTASRLEGFGLPIIEAQQQGIPVVCSDIPIFHEVGAHSVLYFDPDNPMALAAQVEKLSDEAFSSEIIARGHENVRRFTWEKSAEQAMAICQSIVK